MLNKVLFVCQDCHNKVQQTKWCNGDLISHSSGVWKSKIKMLGGLVPSEGREIIGPMLLASGGFIVSL